MAKLDKRTITEVTYVMELSESELNDLRWAMSHITSCANVVVSDQAVARLRALAAMPVVNG